MKRFSVSCSVLPESFQEMCENELESRQHMANREETRSVSDSISFIYKDETFSVKCSDMTANCSLCTDSDGQARCTECQRGYHLVGWTCMSCSDQFPGGNCAECNSNGCTACSDEDMNVAADGRCVKCLEEEQVFDTTSKTCVACSTMFSRCSKCNADMCTDCEDQLYIHDETTGACQTCNELHGSGCTSCNKSHCTDCVDNGCCQEGEKIITVPGTTHPDCGICSDFDENCIDCSATVCTKCKDGMFADKGKGICVPCSEEFADCGQCNADQCTQCIDSNTTKWILTPNGCIPDDTVVPLSSSRSSQPVAPSSSSLHPLVVDSSSKKEDSSNTGMIVGIVVGCLLIVGIVSFTVYCFATRGAKHGKINPEFLDEDEDSNYVSMSVL